jgi:hypothetical protein
MASKAKNGMKIIFLIDDVARGWLEVDNEANFP